MKRSKVAVFYESLLPEGTAVALRSSGILHALQQEEGFELEAVLTTTQFPIGLGETKVLQVGSPRDTGNSSLIYRARREFGIGLSACWRILQIGRHIDLLYISSPPFISSIIISVFCILFRKPYILEVRDLYPEVYVHSGVVRKKGISFKILSGVTKSIYKSAKVIITATNGLRSNILSLAPGSKVLTVQNGFPLKLLHISNPKFSTFTLVYHGILGEFQDVELLCKIGRKVSELPDINLIVIGDGSKADTVKRSFNGRPNLKFLGRLGYEETVGIVSKCHVGMSLRTDEPVSIDSFPVKNWEYLGLGIPSVTTPSSSEGAKFLRENGCSIDLKTDSVGQIMDEINKIKNDPIKYKKIVDACLSIRAMYTRELIAERAVKEIMSVIS